MSGDVESRHLDNVFEQTFKFNDWTIVSHRSHILQSQCCHNCKEKKVKPCLFCEFQRELNLPHFPDMTFAKNMLQLNHKNNFRLEFNCLEALKCINAYDQNTKVDVAEDWVKARDDCEYAKQVKNPFDWTFTTVYKGHFKKTDNHEVKIESTDERIDMEKLKLPENILFYDVVDLFEDELADNGVAKLSVKIRIMPDSFFVLLQFFLRVDNVLVRLNDTRFYHEIKNNYLIREYTRREEKLNESCKIPLSVLKDPKRLSQFLSLKELVNEKIFLPSTG